jgi:ABC-type multidrug transport system fused ATPase/permease subunit
MFKATKYSLAFCWRGAREIMIRRLAISATLTLLLYVSIYANGLIINTVQMAAKNYRGEDFYTEFARSGLLLPTALILLTLLTRRVLGSYNGQLRGKWNEVLRFANQRELQEHRSTLDVGRIKSKEYDDLESRIEQMPSSWGSRISFSEQVLGILTDAASLITFGISLTWYNHYYALIILVCSIPMMVVEFNIVSLWWNISQELVPEYKKRSVLERPYKNIVAFVQAQMFGQMPILRKKIDMSVGRVLEEHEKIRGAAVKSRLLANTMTICGLVGIFLHAAWSVVAHNGGLGNLTIILGVSGNFQGSLASIVNTIAEQWNNAKGAVLIEEEFFGLKPLIKTDYPIVPPYDITPEIRFEHVSFSYPGSEQLVLDDVSFVIKPGSKVAIVGASGNGKSTVQALMMRYYDPTSGNVLVQGINLRNIRPSDWSRVASALTQEYIVLDRKVGEEIASSRLDEIIDIGGVRASATFANFDSVIDSDPNGYDSQIGTEFGGRDFSGGERQRLALARVHYRGTPILILDEPDAKLDAESAQKVIDNIFALTGVTVVLITHHVSRAERCDHVIVMGKGKVVEQGIHEELMALNGAYVSIREKDRERLAHQGVRS